MNRTTREFDIVVWGATGFTGRLVAEYLAEREGGNGTLRWAIAGRNHEKLAELGAEIRRGLPGAGMERVPQLLADSTDLASLRELVSRARVVISTVGPYALHGSTLVQACAEAGTDYVDLCGEPHWIRRMIDAWHDSAQRSGARIVHCCGFDSIPFDLGVWYLQQQLKASTGASAITVHGVVRRMRGGASGGTIASMLNFVEEAARDPVLRRLAANANALLPLTDPPARPVYARDGVGYEPTLGTWTGPFVMATINTKIVRRTHALLGEPWGRDFNYTEATATGAGATGRLRAETLRAGLGAFMLGVAVGPTRGLIRRLLPAPGEGPDQAARLAGNYEVDFVGLDGAGRALGIATVSGDRDPGYGSTSRMLAESALVLAGNEVINSGGSWTPAACLGEPLLRRLQARAGLEFGFRPPG